MTPCPAQARAALTPRGAPRLPGLPHGSPAARGALVALSLALAPAALAQGKVTKAGTLGTARTNHTATALDDGRVLVAGGRGADGLSTLASVELFEPKTRRWQPGPPMAVGRSHHAATLLADGRVLVTGGTAHESKEGKNRFVALASAEVYEPKANRWTTVSPLAQARNGHSATRLKDGRVLVVGGAREQRSHLTAVELFDPASGAWQPRRPLARARWLHEAVRLSDGSVVVLGGRSNQPAQGQGPGAAVAEAERFDASSGTWHAVPGLNEARQRTAAVAHADTVTVVGGQTTSSSTNYVESWTPGAASWVLGEHLSMALSAHSATLLPSGDVVVIGGEPPNEVDTARVQRFDAAQKRWCLAGALEAARKGHSATLLPDGRVLVVGGTSAGLPEPAAELWEPAKGRCEEPPGVSLEW